MILGWMGTPCAVPTAVGYGLGYGIPAPIGAVCPCSTRWGCSGFYGSAIRQLSVTGIFAFVKGRRKKEKEEKKKHHHTTLHFEGSQGQFIKQSAPLMKYFFVKIFIDLLQFCMQKTKDHGPNASLWSIPKRVVPLSWV